MPRGAVPTSPAHGIERQYHLVPGLQPIDTLAYIRNRARAFVSEDHRPHEVLGVSVDGVVVGVAYASANHLEQDLAAFRRVDFEGFDRYGLFLCSEYGGLGFHV